MVDDVRSKILFTVLCLLIYRLGCGVTIPFVNTTALTAMFGSTSVLDYYNLVSGGALSQCAVFAIGVSAYINASIIIQLLTVAIPKLEEISKDIGGQKQINKITQYVGCGLAVITAVGYFFASLMRFAISRKREYMADAGSAEMTKNPLALASALRKISADPAIEAVERKDVAQLFIQNPKKKSKSIFSGINGLFATHPPIEKRIEILEQF